MPARRNGPVSSNVRPLIHMRQFSTAAIATAMAAAALWPSSALASPACGDFLSTLAKTPPRLEFVGCKPDKQSQLRVLVATYRVKGENAARVESYFNRHARMPRLRFYCCGWEVNVRSSPQYGTLTGHQNAEYEVSMKSEETLISVRKNWGRIQWFYVSVTLLLEEA